MKGNELAMKAARLIEKAIATENGQVVSRFFDNKHLMENRKICKALLANNIEMRLGGNIWTETFTHLFRVPTARTPAEEFSIFKNATIPIIHNFPSLSTTLGVPCLKTIASTFRYYAMMVDFDGAVNAMRKLLPLALTKRSARTDESSALFVVNQLMGAFFARAHFKDASRLLKAVASSPIGNIEEGDFPQNEYVTFRFYKGRIAAINQSIKEAKEDLEYAFDKIPLKHNRRLLLTYLIPVNLCLGFLPSPELLQAYDLTDLFSKFSESVIAGDISLYDQTLSRLQVVFIKLGLFELMIKGRQNVLLQLLKMTYAAWGYNPQMPVQIFQAALNITGPYSLDEASNLIATLVNSGFVKGFVQNKLHYVVFKESEPFPVIETKE